MSRPFKWILLLAALLALGMVIASRQVRPPAAQALAQGDAQRAAYLYYSAIASYRRAAQEAPADPHPWLRLGEAYIELQQYVDAAQAFAQASQRGGMTREVHSGLARALEGLGDLTGAAEHWRQASELQPDEAAARLGLARVLIAQAQWNEAREVLRDLAEQQPGNVEAHFKLGQLLALDEPEAARAHFHAAMQDTARLTDISDWLAILEGTDDAAWRATQLGRLLLQRGELHLARRAFERAVELNPAYAETRAYLGYVLAQLGKDGRPQLEQAVKAAPDSVMVQYLWGLLLQQRGDLAQAQAAFEAALARDPTNAALAVEIGQTLLQKQDYIGGETWLIKAAELEPNNPAWAKQLARFYLGSLVAIQEKGLPSAQRAVRLAPTDAEANDWLGWAYYLSGDMAAAEAELSLALALNPRLASAHYHMAAVLTAQGQSDKARLETERAASLDPMGEIGRRARQILEEN
jgi:tetratricopeptide (TPR) repeat protein